LLASVDFCSLNRNRNNSILSFDVEVVRESRKNISLLGHLSKRIGVFLPALRFRVRVSSSRSGCLIVILLDL